MLGHDPEHEPPDDAVFDSVDKRDHLAELLELTDEFFRQASPQVRAELALFLTTQHGSSPEPDYTPTWTPSASPPLGCEIR